MYLHQYGKIFEWLYPRRVWSNNDRKVYLTFDDGPIPEVTPWVLDLLDQFEIKATFFCVGDNIKKHPEVFRQVIQRGHSVGNHTHHHLNGRKEETEVYLKDIELCKKEMKKCGVDSDLFRPPHGRLTWRQANEVLKEYKIIMWSALSADFDQDLPAEKCLKETVEATKPGSIVLFHDSVKTYSKLKIVLPVYIQTVLNKGYQFDKL